MDVQSLALMTVLIFAAAVLYSSVGHAGASGYLAVMALFGVAPAVMKPSALVLNLLVATIGTVQFARAGCLSARLVIPFLAGSLPLAYVGGLQDPNAIYYKPLVGLVLLLSAYRFLRRPVGADEGATRRVPVGVAVLVGAGLGLLAGLTGTGGGIFLSPVLLFAGWATLRQTSGAAVLFILGNSLAGLLGQWDRQPEFPREILYWAVAAVLGGTIGSYLGAKRLGVVRLQGLLALVLLIAGGKLLVQGIQGWLGMQ